MATHHFTVYTRAQYYAQLVKHINATKTGDTVRLMTMGFRAEKPDIAPILHALTTAARRGVDVHLIVDAMTFLMGDHNTLGPLIAFKNLPRRLPPPFNARRNTLEALRSNGGNYSIINKPSRIFKNPLAGRSHLKLAIINDHIFTGGCNLTRLNHLDLMVHWQDQPTAKWLNTLVDKVIVHQNVRDALQEGDTSFKVDKDSSLLIDCGKPGQSIIFDAALRLIDSAEEHILITCQYFPNRRIAKHLQAAHDRGVIVKIIFNHSSTHRFPMNFGVAGALWQERQRLSPELFAHILPKGHPYLHAKLLATDQGTIIGSHNFVPTGVAFGTAEIALFKKDDIFTKYATSTLLSQVRSSHEHGTTERQQ